jgi:phosphohistidine phosphatase
MKTLYLLRHAKSSWKDVSIDDFDRPLNKRGKKDAPFMAGIFVKMDEKPEQIITSPALRAYTTAQIFAEALKINSGLIKEPGLYLADRNTITEIIKKTDPGVKSLMIVAHNPGITEVSDFLSGTEIQNIPTTGIVKLKLLVDTWAETGLHSCKLQWFEYPKKYLK